MSGRGGAPGVEPGAPAQGVDQVEAVRDWLRQRGVDPGEATVPTPSRRRDDVAPRDGAASSSTDDPWVADGPGDDHAGRGPDRSERPSGRRPSDRSGLGADRWRAPADDDRRSHDADADPEELARRIVVNKLAVQARTRTELERALARRDVPEDAAASVLDRMGEVGLIDDATFAKDWVASRQQRRHLSRTALRRELQTKGVDRDLIDDALADVDPDDEHGAALDLARRRASTMGGLSRDVAYRRLGGVLARRGFTGLVVAQVLDDVLRGRED